MIRLLRLSLFTLTLFAGLNSYAQQDTIFWFAPPEVSASSGDNPIYVRVLSYDSPATVTLSQPANGAFVPIVLTLTANDLDSINLTPFLASVESPAANVVANNGLKVSSTAPISAFYELKANGSREQFSLKGNKAIGTNFYTPFQTFWANASTTPASFSSIDVVATENNTTVLITPRTAVTGHVANTSFSVTLNAGQTYSARDMNVSAATTLAGSIVSSNKPVSVTVFNGSLNNGGCVSQVGDQITPTGYIGKDYIVRRGNGTGERVYILATQNGTSISVNNSTTTSTLINWSETYSFVVSDTVNYIKTNKPVYVFHVSGSGCKLSGAQIPPLRCTGRSQVAFTRTTSDSISAVLFIRSGFENQFTLNGNPLLIPAASFADVPGTAGEYKVAKVGFSLADVPLHSYNRILNSGDIYGFGVIQGTGTAGSSYAFFSDFVSYPFINAGPDDTTCANVGFPLNGVIGGGSITGYWSTNGYGSFQGNVNNLNNLYQPSPLDSIVGPIRIILNSTGSCATQRDTFLLTVTPAPIVNASADQVLCKNNAVVQLNGNVQGGATTGNWTSLGTGTFSDATDFNAEYTPSAADLSAGSVKLVLTSTGNGSCLAVSDTMRVDFTTAPSVDAGADTLIVCSNNAQVSLSGSVSGPTSTGKWITTGNGLFSPNNVALNTNYQPSPADIASTNLLIYLESTNNGNCNAVKDSVRILFTASPVVDAGQSIVACSNDSEVTLAGLVSGPTSTGVWSGGAGVFDPGTTDLDASYTATPFEVSSGSIVLTLTSTNNGNCNAVSDNVQINFVSPPFANFNAQNNCLDITSEFNDFSLPVFGNVDTWQWDFGDGTNSGSQNPDHDYGSAGTYSVELIVSNSAGCYDTVTKNVTIFPLPTADFNYEATCTGTQLFLDFTDNSSSVDNINFYYYDFGGQGTSATANPTQLFNGNGNFTITHIVSTINGCKDTISETVNIPPRPQAGFFYNTNNGMNVGAVFNFVDTSSFANSWYWTFGNGNNSTASDPSNTYFANGMYTVTQYAYGAFGCVDSVSQKITINTVTDEIQTLIPNAISPNGDGKNDVWKLEFIGLEYPNAQVFIFNRWGQQIFESTGYKYPWDATYNGEAVPDGSYYYVIKLNDGTPDSRIFKGALLVLKNGN